jgi:hypothetical protein
VEAGIGRFLAKTVQELVFQRHSVRLVESIDRKGAEALLTDRKGAGDLKTDRPGVGLNAEWKGGREPTHLRSKVGRGDVGCRVELGLMTPECWGDRVAETQLAAVIDKDVPFREVAMKGLFLGDVAKESDGTQRKVEDVCGRLPLDRSLYQRDAGMSHDQCRLFIDLGSGHEGRHARVLLRLCEEGLLCHDVATRGGESLVSTEVAGEQREPYDDSAAGLDLASGISTAPAATSEQSPHLVCSATVVPDGFAGVHGKTLWLVRGGETGWRNASTQRDEVSVVPPG